MNQSVDDTPTKFESIALRLRDRLLAELEKLETTTELDGMAGEQRFKSLSGYLKLLQNVDEILKRIHQERDKNSDRGIDILEFRGQLEEQIAKLVDNKTEAAIP